ncbi:hypothetical protein [Aestuariivirga litoralis]|uniref:hypothetical protein n=1 Tax=Aestuariivirga litoralis TaxID=2650924 RepID=UPI0018C6A7C7|nr:hypothetical protein [Aestuariivirga litoralis]MBG1231292.1 hypothetical protein [Aestuariivirga litoralis]
MFIKSILAVTAIAGMLAGTSILSSNAASAKQWCGNPGQQPCVDQGNMNQGNPPPPNMPPPGNPPRTHGNNNGNPNFNLDITIGDGGGYDDNGYGGNGGWHKPRHGFGGGYGGPFVSCMQAKSIVRYNGFRGVQTQSCGGPVHTFLGMKKGRLFEIDVSRRGRIVNIDRAY